MVSLGKLRMQISSSIKLLGRLDLFTSTEVKQLKTSPVRSRKKKAVVKVSSSKAFNRLNQNILTYKLSEMGTPEWYLKVVTNKWYWDKRYKEVKIWNTMLFFQYPESMKALNISYLNWYSEGRIDLEQLPNKFIRMYDNFSMELFDFQIY